MAVAVDSSVWIDFLLERKTQQTVELRRILGNDIVMVPDLVAYEVLRGAKDERHAEELEKLFLACEVVETNGWGTAVNAARNYRQLRSNAFTPRSAVDVLIATWCVQNGVALLHNDRDFLPMELHLGLKVWRGDHPSPVLA